MPGNLRILLRFVAQLFFKMRGNLADSFQASSLLPGCLRETWQFGRFASQSFCGVPGNLCNLLYLFFGLFLIYLAIFSPIILWDSICSAILLELQVCCEDDESGYSPAGLQMYLYLYF